MDVAREEHEYSSELVPGRLRGGMSAADGGETDRGWRTRREEESAEEDIVWDGNGRAVDVQKRARSET